MSTVTTVNSPTSFYQAAGGTSRNSSAQALIAIGTALQSNGAPSSSTPVASAQQGVTDESQPALRPPPVNASADVDYANLANAVQAGNLSEAQAALVKLQVDLKQPHVHHVGGAVPAPTQVSADSTTAVSTDSTVEAGTSGNYVNVTV